MVMIMNLSEQLNYYSKTIGFSFKELSEASGISTGTISNYRAGKQIPKMNNPKLSMLAKAIVELGRRNGLTFDYDSVLLELQKSVSGNIEVSFDIYISNLNKLLKTLNISNIELARRLNYDPSQISRFLSGERLPSDIGKFSSQIASFIANNYSDNCYCSLLQELFDCGEEETDSPTKIHKKIIEWLGSNTDTTEKNPINSFLDNLDKFDLNDFIGAINFNNIKISSVPFEIPTTNYYHGLEKFKQAEFDFMKAAALSRSKADIIMYSDMPIAEMARDEDFAKKYMYGMAILLKKNLHISFIHDVHRSFEEMLLGLEGNIPMYMTGQISPYYFSEPQSRVFSHLLKVSGTAAMCGFAVTGDHKDGLYLVTKNKTKVQKYRTAAEMMLKSARPLMDIYRGNLKAKFTDHLRSLWKVGSRRMIFSSLPIFTISEELLLKILHRANISDEGTNEILSFRADYRTAMTELLKKYSISVEISSLSKEKFDKSKVSLELSQLFYDNSIAYNYEEYTEHLQQTFDFAESFDNCTVKVENEPTFKNISFSIIENKCVIVSKANYPAIHFIIHHPKMVRAFENFVPPIKG